MKTRPRDTHRLIPERRVGNRDDTNSEPDRWQPIVPQVFASIVPQSGGESEEGGGQRGHERFKVRLRYGRRLAGFGQGDRLRWPAAGKVLDVDSVVNVNGGFDWLEVAAVCHG